MKELSIHMSNTDMNGFFYSLKKNTLLLYKRQSSPDETLDSVISREFHSRGKDDFQIKVIWNNRCSLLVPSVIFKIEDIYSYIRCISSVVHRPQCMQYGELVAVWDTDQRINIINSISDHLGIPITHTHQRVEHIIATADNTTSFSMYDNLLYITEKTWGKLLNSIVAQVENVYDVMYYIKSIDNKHNKIETSLPEKWSQLLNKL